MRTRFLTAAFVVMAALLLAGVPAALAAPDPQTEGTPDLNHDSPTGYYIWHNDDGFHLRTHGPNAEHDFVAYLRTNGTFENVDPVRLEDGDRVEVLDGGQLLEMHFHTFDATDGVNFTVRGGERLRFSLRLDGALAPTDQIFLGNARRHPATNPFRIEL
jgi:hypothetical protein